MTTAIDSNVLVTLWDVDPELSAASERALDSAQERGALAVSGAVYAELLALPGRTEKMLDAFFLATAIPVDWEAGEQIWRVASQGISELQRATEAEQRRTAAPDPCRPLYRCACSSRPL